MDQRVGITKSPSMMILNIPDWPTGNLVRMEYPSSIAKVKLHGMTKPMIVTKKLWHQHKEMENYALIIWVPASIIHWCKIRIKVKPQVLIA